VPDGCWCASAPRIAALNDVADTLVDDYDVVDLSVDSGTDRWPSFTAAAVRAGFRSASALPLRYRDVTLGAMNLLSASPDPMADEDRVVARAFADLAAVSIVQNRAHVEARRLNEQLSAALTSRVVIEQAKGVLAERAGIDLTEAFERMRAYARDHNSRLADVARAAVAGTLDPDAWLPRSPSS
jgi:GAF domain-containing protein